MSYSALCSAGHGSPGLICASTGLLDASLQLSGQEKQFGSLSAHARELHLSVQHARSQPSMVFGFVYSLLFITWHVEGERYTLVLFCPCMHALRFSN